MKILIITDYDSYNGLGSHNYTLYKGFQNQWYDVEILNLVSRHCFKEDPHYGVNILSPSILHSLVGFLFGVFFVFRRGVRRHLRENHYDFVLIGHQWLAYLHDVLDKNSVNFGIVVHDVFSLYTGINKNKIKNFIYNNFLARKLCKFENVVCLSHFTLVDYQKRIGSFTKNLVYIHSWFDPISPTISAQEMEIFREKYWLRWKKIVLHVGSEDTRKNIASFLHIAVEYQDDPTMLFVRIWEKSSFAQRFIQEHMLENVLYFSCVSQEVLRMFYGTASLFLYTSTLEWFGRPLVEAYLHHVPCISSPISDMPTIFADSPNVHFVSDPYDIPAYIQLIEQHKDDLFVEETLDISLDTEVANYVRFMQRCILNKAALM